MSDGLDPKMKFYPEGCVAYDRVFAASALGVLLLLGTLYAVYRAYKSPKRGRIVLYALAATWAVAPPIWFWVEYFFIYRKWGIPGTFELFKYGQQVATAVWAGIAVSLAAFASSKIFD